MTEFIDMFDQLYNESPTSLKIRIDECKGVQQNPIYHPEGDVYIHIKLVTNRLYNFYNDINLTLCGFFHDLGKVKTTYFDTSSNTWKAPTHEDESVVILEDYKDFIIQKGGDFDTIKYIISQHMRFKYVDSMNIKKIVELFDNENIDLLIKFNSADFGGDELIIKDIKYIDEIKKKVLDYKIARENNLTIKEKFNGNLVIKMLPNLKGKELGDAINAFRSTFDDFESYVFNNTSSDILSDFLTFFNKKSL